MLNKNFWFRLSSSPHRHEQGLNRQRQVKITEKGEQLIGEVFYELQKSLPILSRRRKGNKIAKGSPIHQLPARINTKFELSQPYNFNPQSNRSFDLSVRNLSKDNNISLDFEANSSEIIHSRKTMCSKSRIKRRIVRINKERSTLDDIRWLDAQAYAKKITIDVKSAPKELQSQKKVYSSRIRGAQLATDQKSDKKIDNTSKFRNLRHKSFINYRPWSPQKRELQPCENGQDIDFYLQATN